MAGNGLMGIYMCWWTKQFSDENESSLLWIGINPKCIGTDFNRLPDILQSSFQILPYSG
jgi:hypothetical protein